MEKINLIWVVFFIFNINHFFFLSFFLWSVTSYNEATSKYTNKVKYYGGAVVRTSDDNSAGPIFIPDEGRRHTAHPAIDLPKWDGR